MQPPTAATISNIINSNNATPMFSAPNTTNSAVNPTNCSNIRACGRANSILYLIYMTAVKANQKLWDQVVREVRDGTVAGPAGKWNARKAQRAVAIYKERGGKYVGRKSRQNSLSQWTAEDWGYIDGKPGNRYLPARVREGLTDSEKRAENRRKRVATRAGKQYAPYSPSVRARMSRRSRKPPRA